MSWFPLGKKDKENKDSGNGILGLLHLEKFTEVVPNPQGLKSFEWRRRVISTAGNKQFRIKYYGNLHANYPSLIVRTELAPQQIIAIDVQTNEEILLFDAGLHGYNAITWEEFSKEQMDQREPTKIYQDQAGNELFEILLSAYYQIDYDGEFGEDVDEQGEIEIKQGQKIKFTTLKRNACDYLNIVAINAAGKRIEILSEELG